MDSQQLQTFRIGWCEHVVAADEAAIDVADRVALGAQMAASAARLIDIHRVEDDHVQRAQANNDHTARSREQRNVEGK